MKIKLNRDGKEQDVRHVTVKLKGGDEFRISVYKYGNNETLKITKSFSEGGNDNLNIKPEASNQIEVF